ncbi:hypothetical protein ACIQ9E_07010 [Streptomyces sp. NPDC094448]|uniref:hypothetical protein n=1 Tax=Streptomyces sp. NPDC094448 TaxID=3366063 RepID=UPI00380331CC
MSGDGRWIAEGAGLADIGPIAAREGLSVLEIAAEEPSLEEAYLALTSGQERPQIAPVGSKP